MLSTRLMGFCAVPGILMVLAAFPALASGAVPAGLGALPFMLNQGQTDTDVQRLETEGDATSTKVTLVW